MTVQDENLNFVKRAYHDAAEEGGWFHASDYQPLLGTLPGRIILQIDDDSYQGDSYILFKDDTREWYGKPRYGWLTFGLGSCSGCDALQAAESFEDIAEIRAQLLRETHWEEEPGKLADWLEAQERKYDWDYREGAAARAAAVGYLRAKANAE